jgi:hypothetical protein
MFVDDRQPLELTAGRGAIEHEVPTLHVVATLRSTPNASVVARPPSSAFFAVFAARLNPRDATTETHGLGQHASPLRPTTDLRFPFFDHLTSAFGGYLLGAFVAAWVYAA